MTITTKVLNGTTEIYSSSVTMNGNEVTGTINPIPAIRKMLKKNGLHVVSTEETETTRTIYVK